MAMTMALSPASTKSITIIASNAEKNSGLNSSNFVSSLKSECIYAVSTAYFDRANLG
jgi:hypothetical protein